MSQNCNLCNNAITDKCRKCGKFVYVLFCSIQDPQSDNEIHCVHKLGDTRCYNAQKENRIDSAIVSVSAPTEANWNLLICPKCENEYKSEEDLRSHIEVAHNGLEESFPSLCSEVNFSKIHPDEWFSTPTK